MFIYCEIIYDWIKLHYHAHLRSNFCQLLGINWSVEQSHISTWPLKSHRTNIEQGRFSSSIGSKQSKFFTLFYSKTCIWNSLQAIFVNFFNFLELNELQSLLIKNFFSEFFMLNNSNILVKLLPIFVNLLIWLLVIFSFVGERVFPINENVCQEIKQKLEY